MTTRKLSPEDQRRLDRHIASLDAIQDDETEAARGHIEQTLMAWVPAMLRDAVERLRDREREWASRETYDE